MKNETDAQFWKRLKEEHETLKIELQEAHGEIEVLSAKVISLEEQKAALEEQLDTLQAELKKFKDELNEAITPEERKALKEEVDKIQKKINQLRAEKFTQKSEKRHNKRSRRRRFSSSKRAKPTVEIPTEEKEHKLLEEDCFCDKCGGRFEEIKDDFSTQEIIEVIESLLKKVKHKKQRYRCGCSRTKVAKLDEPELVKNGKYDLSFAVEVAINKYLYHLPLSRQVGYFGQQGLEVTSQTLWGYQQALSNLFLPVYRKIKQDLLRKPYFHMDFSSWYLSDKDTPIGKRVLKQLTCISNHELAYFEMLDGRGQMVVAQFLEGFSGILISDADATLCSLEKAKDNGLTVPYKDKEGEKQKFIALCNYLHAGCWSHCRRNFVTAENLHYTICSKLLDFIGELYAKEAEYKRKANGNREKLLEIRAKRRPKESAEIVSKIYKQKDWLERKSVHLLSDDILKGITYLKNHEKKLKVFLRQPEIELDNNSVEQDIRTVVQGRKNHYQSRSQNGVESSAILYSLVVSCRKLGISVKEYFLFAGKALLKDETNVITPLDYWKTLNN